MVPPQAVPWPAAACFGLLPDQFQGGDIQQIEVFLVQLVNDPFKVFSHRLPPSLFAASVVVIVMGVTYRVAPSVVPSSLWLYITIYCAIYQHGIVYNILRNTSCILYIAQY